MALAVIVVCWLVSVPVRGEARKRRCQNVVHVVLKWWEAIMEAIGVFHVDFPEIDTIRGLRGTIIAPFASEPDRRAAFPRADASPDLSDEEKRVEKPIYGQFVASGRLPAQ